MPVDKKRNYTSFFNAVKRLLREEGFLSLMKGTSPTVAKGMALNLGMFATFDTIKEILNKEYPGKTASV